MLGDIGEGLEGDREDRDDQRRRLQEENCIDTSLGFVSRDFYIMLFILMYRNLNSLLSLQQPAGSCNQVSCQDEARLCDGSYNYPYIAKLISGEVILKVTLPATYFYILIKCLVFFP